MKRKQYRPYVLLALLLFGCLNLPKVFGESLRYRMVAIGVPFWKSITSAPPEAKREIERLKAEKQKLEYQNKLLRERLFFEERIENQLKKLKETANVEADKPFFSRRQEHAKELLKHEAQALFGRVVFREPASWNSTFWIDVGEKDNEAVGLQVVSVNSPVLAGSTLIGIVEEVGKKQSRVRLITDSAMALSVRIARGAQRELETLDLIEKLLLNLSISKIKWLSVEDEAILFEKANCLKEVLRQKKEGKLLAKGELLGSSTPLWRTRSLTLKGVGFNYDFADVEGPARELRTGKSYDHLTQDEPLTLIEEGDLLVTTGLEGLFPADLPVAYVTRVYPLKEGEPSYSIEAKLCSDTIQDLSTVRVLPSLNFKKQAPF